VRSNEKRYSVFLFPLFFSCFLVCFLGPENTNKYTYVEIAVRVVVLGWGLTIGGFKYYLVVSLTIGCLVTPLLTRLRFLSGLPNWIPISPNRKKRSLSESKDPLQQYLRVPFSLCTFHPFDIAPFPFRSPLWLHSS